MCLHHSKQGETKPKRTQYNACVCLSPPFSAQVDAQAQVYPTPSTPRNSKLPLTKIKWTTFTEKEQWPHTFMNSECQTPGSRHPGPCDLTSSNTGCLYREEVGNVPSCRQLARGYRLTEGGNTLSKNVFLILNYLDHFHTWKF